MVRHVNWINWKTGSDELVDTYTITLSDGNKFTFTVTNGKDGLTPYIGPMVTGDSSLTLGSARWKGDSGEKGDRR